MAGKLVREIMVPFADGVPLSPSVKPTDRLVVAVEVMATCNLEGLAVVWNERPVGMIRLEDALRALGLKDVDSRR